MERCDVRNKEELAMSPLEIMSMRVDIKKIRNQHLLNILNDRVIPALLYTDYTDHNESYHEYHCSSEPSGHDTYSDSAGHSRGMNMCKMRKDKPDYTPTTNEQP